MGNTLDPRAQSPLYEQLKIAIKQDIDDKIYSPGDKLPSESELEQMYSVSRITVRRAIKELCDEGLLVKKQGKGTFVTGFNMLDYDDVDFFEAMKGIGKRPTAKVLGKYYGEIPLHIAKVLGLNAKQKNIIFKRLMIADGEPVSIDTYYLPTDLFDLAFEKLEKDVVVFRMVEKDFHINTNYSRKILGISKATAEAADIFNCPKDTPMFEFFQITYDEENHPVLLTTSQIVGINKYYVLDDCKRGAKTTGLIWGE